MSKILGSIDTKVIFKKRGESGSPSRQNNDTPFERKSEPDKISPLKKLNRRLSVIRSKSISSAESQNSRFEISDSRRDLLSNYSFDVEGVASLLKEEFAAEGKDTLQTF